MSKNLYDDKDFWIGRVAMAKKSSDPYQSVFRCSKEKWELIRDSRVSIINQHIHPSEKVLDAGCAFGWLSQYIPNDYVGVDQTPALLNYGKELYPNITFVESTLQELPFEDNCFDWVVCSCVKYGIVENEELGLIEPGRWARIEKEFLRVAKAGIIWPSYQPDYEMIKR